MSYRITSVPDGRLIDEIDIAHDGTVSSTTGSAADIARSFVANAGVDQAREALADWSNGYLQSKESDVDTERRAQGHDIAEEGHDYWVHGKGLGKWADTDDPWTELHRHLVEVGMPDGEAKRTAAEWFHEVFHFWPGSDVNRVTHGHPPRGEKVGPG